MSILQEYEEIRKEVGEEIWNSYNWFLLNNDNYLLSDLLYNEDIFKKYENWIKDNPLPNNFIEKACDKIGKFIEENNNLLNDGNDIISNLQRVEEGRNNKKFEREDVFFSER